MMHMLLQYSLIHLLTEFDTTNFKTKLDAEIKNYDQLEYFDAKYNFMRQIKTVPIVSCKLILH